MIITTKTAATTSVSKKPESSVKKIDSDSREDLPSHLLNHLADEIRDFLIHAAVLVRVREALAAEFLLDGVEAFVEVVAVVGAASVGRGSGVHGYFGVGDGGM